MLDLSGYCIEGLPKRGLKVLTPVPAEHRAGIVSIEVEDNAEAAAWGLMFTFEGSTDMVAAVSRGDGRLAHPTKRWLCVPNRWIDRSHSSCAPRVVRRLAHGVW